MMKGRCWHLPSVLCDCVSSTGLGNSVEEAGGSDGCQELYVIQNTAIDGQLPSSVSMSTQSTESTEIDGPICRICHEGGNRESLLSLCDCRGTLGMVHKSCLEDWLSTSNTSYCELCRTEFSIKRQLRPLTEWQCNEKRRLFCDMVLYLFITVSLAILFWLGLIWALQGLRLGKIPLAAFLIASTFIVFTLYVWWTLVFFRYQFQLYSEWRRTNSKVRLLIPEAKESNSSQHSWLFTKLLKRSVPLRGNEPEDENSNNM